MSDSAPLVTIGLPVYNAAKHMMISVEDLLGQTFTDFELIISDNDSSDETGCFRVAAFSHSQGMKSR